MRSRRQGGFFIFRFTIFSQTPCGGSEVTGMAKVLKMQFTNTMGNGSTFEVSVDNPKAEVDLAMVREVSPYIGKVMGAGDAVFKKAWLETIQIEALS